MSRTTRQIPDRSHRQLTPGKPREPDTIPFIQVAPDGKRSFTVEVMRDSRATGLRSHRADRRIARATLRQGEDTLPAGKMRRYSLRYAEYLW